MFADNADTNTPPQLVHELVAGNRESLHLNLGVRDDTGGHQGTPDARRALADLLRALAPPR